MLTRDQRWCPLHLTLSTIFLFRHDLQVIVHVEVLVLIVTTLTTSSTLCSLDDGLHNSFQGLVLLIILLLVCVLVIVQPLKSVTDGVLDGGLVIIAELVTELLGIVDLVLDVVGESLELVAGINLLLEHPVLLGVLLSLTDHTFDLLLTEATLLVLDNDLLRLTGSLIFGTDVQDTVGINLESDLNLRNTTGGGGNVGKVELSEKVIVLGHGTLTLEHLDGDGGLLILVGGESLGLLVGDDSVTGDKLGHDSSNGFDTLGKRSDIKKKDTGSLLTTLTGKDTTLDSGTVCNSLIGVNTLVWLLVVEELLQHLNDLGDTGGTTNKHNLVDGRLIHLCVTDDLLDWLHALTEQVHVHFLETSTSDRGVEVLTVVQGVDLDGGLGSGRQSTLGTLASSAETTKSTLVASDILLLLALELLNEVLDETVVEVLTTQVGVTRGGLHLEDTFLNGQQRHIEGTTTKIEDKDILLTSSPLLVQTVGNSGSGGLVNNTHTVQVGNGGGILGCLALRVVEVGWDGNDGVGDVLSKELLGNLLHLDQNHGGYLLRSELLLLTLELNLEHRLLGVTRVDLERPQLDISLHSIVFELATDKTLGVEDGVCGVHSDLVLGGITNQTLAIGEGDVGRGGAVTLVVGNDFNTIILPHADAGIGSTQVDTDRGSVFGSHFEILFVRFVLDVYLVCRFCKRD
mmetsp:Transcript_13657/g.16416  ORF Transcript_13657/g.16416 Transcript_13657/m.16416 type:complete len:685 (-) Transcript_13657:65-2119(-)